MLLKLSTAALPTDVRDKTPTHCVLKKIRSEDCVEKAYFFPQDCDKNVTDDFTWEEDAQPKALI